MVSVLRGQPHPSFVYAVGTSPRFVLAAVNDAWFEATGFSGHAAGRALEELMPEGLVTLVAARLERCEREGAALAFEEELRFGARVRYWQTHLLPVRVGGEVRYVVGVGHDHTPLQDAHAALAISEAKFRRIVENASDIIYRLRLEPTVGFDYLSPSIEAVTAYPPSASYEDALLLRRLLHARPICVDKCYSGALSVQSELERGTTFRVLLPAAGGGAAAEPSAKAHVTIGRGLVLVVDDEPVVRDVTSRILEALGYSVRTANDGQQCVASFARLSEPPVAVLMGLTIPQLDGLAAFGELRRRRIGVPVILMSGYTEQDAFARFGATGLAGFLQKPFSAEILGAKLGSALGLR